MSQMTTDQRPPEYLRADAARNLHRIVEVAARMHSDDPHVGMAAVAEAADVSRATVYRHFPTREALMDAIRTQALAAGAQAIVECRLEEGGATEALRRLVEAWLDIAQHYGFAQLVGHAGSPLDEEDRAHRRRAFGEPLIALFTRGQAAGEFSTAVTPEWATRMFGATVIAGARAVDDGALTRADAPDTVFHTLTQGLRS
jgi:TetR/AcrR family transcriptional regulator, mexCD-oprJ operon repressor